MAQAKYVLTPSLRRRLRRPLGRLFTPDEIGTSEFRKSFEAAPLVITVGDRVTDTLEAFGRTPDVQVVDKRERREKRTAPTAPFKKLIRVKNPAGALTAASLNAVRRSFKEEKPVRILVEGEEDLLAIPALAYAPDGSVVFYGQPGKGIVVLRVEPESRERARRVLTGMSSSR